jgi:OOP family OmpA-OmpF porin
MAMRASIVAATEMTIVAAFGLGFSAAHAAQKIGQGYISLMGTYISPDDVGGSDLEGGVRGGQLAFGLALEEHWDVELTVSRLDLDVEDSGTSFDQTGVGANLLNVYNRAGRWSPYVIAGLGFLNDDTGASSGEEDNLQAQGGAGLRTRFLGGWLAFRAETLYRWVDADDSRGDWLVNAGIEVALGSRRKSEPAPASTATPPPSPPPDADADGDSVVDRLDKCPATSKGAAVDADGCPRDGDDDGDGVANSIDKCPTTPAGAKVGPLGCSLSLSLGGVNFEHDSAKLLPQGERILAEAVTALKEDPAATLEIQGHTDNRGSEAYNLRLGERRATSVKDSLVSQGIAAGRLTVKSAGETEPVADNETAEGRAANRRVVLKAR